MPKGQSDNFFFIANACAIQLIPLIERGQNLIQNKQHNIFILNHVETKIREEPCRKFNGLNLIHKL